jgi:hypothetical protein
VVHGARRRPAGGTEHQVAREQARGAEMGRAAEAGGVRHSLLGRRAGSVLGGGMAGDSARGAAPSLPRRDEVPSRRARRGLTFVAADEGAQDSAPAAWLQPRAFAAELKR